MTPAEMREEARSIRRRWDMRCALAMGDLREVYTTDEERSEMEYARRLEREAERVERG